jgi:hypothetical protein
MQCPSSDKLKKIVTYSNAGSSRYRREFKLFSNDLASGGCMLRWLVRCPNCLGAGKIYLATGQMVDPRLIG